MFKWKIGRLFDDKIFGKMYSRVLWKKIALFERTLTYLLEMITSKPP